MTKTTQSTTLAICLLLSVTSISVSQVLLPGLESSELDPELHGLVLIEEMNCVACHESEAPFATRSKKAPRLSGVGSRVNPNYLLKFIQDPHGAKPGTTMPDVLRQLDETQRLDAATALMHFLVSQKEGDFSLQAPDAVAAQLGEPLFHSRGCVACHSPRDTEGNELLQATSTPLGDLNPKYSINSLIEFLHRPHAVRPSGRMPNPQLQGKDGERIAHYLLRDTLVPGHVEYTLYRGQVWEGLTSENVEAERAGHVRDFTLESLGEIRHQTALEYRAWLKIPRDGNYVFYLQMNGGSLRVEGTQLVLEEPSNRRGPKQLEGTVKLKSGWRELELTYFHTGREPKFQFEMEGPGFERQPIPASMLAVSNQPIPALEPLEIDPELVSLGRAHFQSFGCANCHDDVKVPPQSAPAFATLSPDHGCLSGEAGPWPHFALDREQRDVIARAIPDLEQLRLDDEQMLAKTLVTFNCIACHDRAGLGGISSERNPHFTGTHPALGNQGRLPPPLTSVGGKLKPEWISQVLLHGKRQREYLDTTMPQYGEANVGHLVELFGKVDELEAVTFPEIADIQESKDAGYEMMGTSGFSCIACHDYNGQQAGGAGALDIVHVTERLKKSWFHLYMREPSRFHSTVIMPSYWPGGKSIRPNILGGDSAQQIEALWAYLEDGPRAKKPKGLSRQSNELRVSDVAEICRGRGTAGYRGIGVGYPERINLAFDSEEMALRMLWKGEFANIDHGSFRARGTEKILLPPGIPFHRLESMDDDWPYKGKTNYTFPQDHGYQFRGYHLDALRRPTFQYHYGEIEVADFFEDLAEDGGEASFRRTLTFESPEAQSSFYFRAAAGKDVAQEPNKSFRVGPLQVRITSDHSGRIREGEPGEVLIPLTLPQGITTLTLEYRW